MFVGINIRREQRCGLLSIILLLSDIYLFRIFLIPVGNESNGIHCKST